MSFRYVLVIRHGERADDLDRSEVPQGDPPITEGGKSRARQIVGDITSTLTDDGSDDTVNLSKTFRLFTSPFLRCRETAESLSIGGLGLLPKVDDDLSEVYGPIRIKTSEPPQPWQPHSVGTRPIWPETLEDARERLRTALLKHIEEEPSDNVALVTHGDAVEAVFSLLFPTRLVYEVEFLGYILLKVPRLPSQRDSPRSITVQCTVAGQFGIHFVDEGSGEDSDPAPIIIGPDGDLAKKRRKAVESVVETVDVGLARKNQEGLSHISTTAVPISSGGHARCQPTQMDRLSPLHHTPYGSMPDHLTSSERTKSSQISRTIFFLNNYLTRVIGVVSTLLLLINDKQNPNQSLLFSGLITIVEFLSTFVPFLYATCPSSPSAPPAAEQRGEEDDSFLNVSRPATGPKVFRYPFVAGVTKLALVIALWVLIMLIGKQPLQPFLPGLCTTPAGLVSCMLFLACDGIRVWPKK